MCLNSCTLFMGAALFSLWNLNSTCSLLNFWVTEQLEVSSNLYDLSVS